MAGLACAGVSPADPADAAPVAASGGGAEVVWDLGERGLVGDADADAVFEAAIDAARGALERDPGLRVTLEIPPGTWVFDRAGPAIHLDGASRLGLRGAGPERTTLRFDRPDEYGLLLEGANGVTVEGLHLTRPGLPTTQGEVTAVEQGRVRFRVHPGFPDPIPLVSTRNAEAHDRTLLRFRGPPLDPELAPNSVAYKLCRDCCEGSDRGGCPGPIRALGGGEVEARLEKDELPDLAIGDRVALKAKSGEQTLRAVDCDDLVVRDVTFTRSVAVPLAVKGASDRTIVERVRVLRSEPVEGRAPFFSGAGGGPQVTAHREGPIIRDCEIVGTTDDGLAVFSHDARDPMRGARIERNTVRDAQGRGINITQSRDGVCADNTVIRSQNASIQLKSNQTAEGTSGGEGAVVGWTLSRNRLVQPWTDPAIYLTRENAVDASGRHDRVVIVDTVVEEASRENPILHVRNTDSVEIRGTNVVSFSEERDVRGRAIPEGPAPLVFVEDAVRVSGSGNRCVEATDRPVWASHRRNAGTVELDWSGAGPPAPPRERSRP